MIKKRERGLSYLYRCINVLNNALFYITTSFVKWFFTGFGGGDI